ncbi:DHA1 family inner membrane transport protein [Amycolatopsis echigonensis]|uniref:DHA1 family inner membrane transport protein n=1 Tax=Amycolatopsis echigonensis TaxID=2576905 RepID=A0A2N3WJN9_9PSEU|nr:MFS transporter [Amycolatopsis niigatensis]PKV94091.1 DHA1 family inner membrane transport protein [Amycolatopsis niigatensis]
MPLSVFSLLLVVFSLTTGEFVIAGILPDVAAGLSVSVASAGLLVTAYAIGMIVGGPLVTLATARVARKPLIAGLIAVSMAGNLGSALAPNYALAVVSRFVAGLVVATFFAVAIATVVSMAPPGKAVSTIAKVTMGLNLGIVAGSPLGTVLGHHLGWRATFGAVAVVSGIALLLVLRFVPPQAATGSVRGELRVLADRDVWQAIGLTVLGNVGVVTVFTYIAPLLTGVSGFSSELLPVLLVLYGVGAVAGNYLGGRWADKALLPSLAWMLAALVVALAAAWLGSPAKPVMAVLVFVLGMLAFGIVPGMQARVIAAGSSAPTLAVAVNASGFQLAAAAAGLLGGQVISREPRSIYLLAAVLTVAGLGIALYALRRERASTDSRR